MTKKEPDPVELIRKVLPVLTKEEFYEVFWMVIHYMVDHYATKPGPRAPGPRARSESVSVPHDNGEPASSVLPGRSVFQDPDEGSV